MQVFDVKRQAGARGDGLTDDTSAIRTALARVLTLSPRPPLFFPAGRYLISQDLWINSDGTPQGGAISGLELLGVDKQATLITTLRRKNPHFFAVPDNLPITLRAVSLGAPGGGTSADIVVRGISFEGTLLRAYTCRRLTIESVRIEPTPYDTLALEVDWRAYSTVAQAPASLQLKACSAVLLRLVRVDNGDAANMLGAVFEGCDGVTWDRGSANHNDLGLHAEATSGLQVDHVLFENNRNGALHLRDAAAPILRNCQFQHHRKPETGAVLLMIKCQGTSDAKIYGCRFYAARPLQDGHVDCAGCSATGIYLTANAASSVRIGECLFLNLDHACQGQTVLQSYRNYCKTDSVRCDDGGVLP